MTKLNVKVLVTGCAGFIGFHLCRRLLLEGYTVVGLDNMNPYYDVTLKESRLGLIIDDNNFSFYQVSLENQQELTNMYELEMPQYVVHLAAQAGVRYSLENPQSYISANIVGFTNLLEACRHHGVEHFLYASSSSVYGANEQLPFSEHNNVDHPVSLYAATKKSNELISHVYSHLFNIPTTGLRFFTVYGPWGRPDMALFKFTKAILSNEVIDVYNSGEMLRDFTYIDDIVEGIYRVMNNKAKSNADWNPTNPDPASSRAPYRIYNIGNNNPVQLLKFISTLEDKLEITAKKRFLPLQPGDVPDTFADVDCLMKDTGFKPTTTLDSGIGKFVDWYLRYYKEESS